MKSRSRATVALLFAAFAVACGDGTGPSTPGTLLLSLNSPNVNDAAVLVQVTGPGITGVAATSSSQQVFWRLVSGEEARAIVIGGIHSGPLLTIEVPDVSRASRYEATIGEIAAEGDSIRASSAGYSLKLTRVGETR